MAGEKPFVKVFIKWEEMLKLYSLQVKKRKKEKRQSAARKGVIRQFIAEPALLPEKLETVDCHGHEDD